MLICIVSLALSTAQVNYLCTYITTNDAFAYINFHIYIHLISTIIYFLTYSNVKNFIFTPAYMPKLKPLLD